MQHDRIEVEKGQTIFAEGEDADVMYVITSGRVQIQREGPEGPVCLAILSKGAFFGEMAIVQKTKRSASAVAAVDSELMIVSASELEMLLKRRPELGVRMIYTLTRRLRATTDLVIDEKAKLALLFDYEFDSSLIPQKPSMSALEESTGPLGRFWSQLLGR